ncbi:hypothetical protein MKEN_00980100 [Mycena kentingensis (nom. inval.)]|nr:hypothetical protein MKEN_00980100 [Mycena kentingensis (nom. inval.)]
MALYGMPYILEDTTGTLAGSEFIDIHDRMHLTLRCTSHDRRQRVFVLDNGDRPACAYAPDSSLGLSRRPLLSMQFGSDGSLGTITFQNSNVPISMRRYLVHTHCGELHTNASTRRFVANDGQPYLWSRRIKPNQEFTCTNTTGHVIASYSLKAPGEPEYPDSSGCILEIEEQFGWLASEIVASLWIMRHITALEQRDSL